jgi:haloalkane dehalogenase
METLGRRQAIREAWKVFRESYDSEFQDMVDPYLGRIAVDLPGFGGSFDPPEFDSISALTQYTMGFPLEALGVERYQAFGNHTGAGMAAEMAALSPDRVLSRMMIGPLLLTEEQSAPYRDQVSGSVSPSHEAEYLKITWDYIHNLGGDRDLDNMNDEFSGALRAWKVRGMIYRCVWDYRFDLFIKDINCPTLLMCAPDDVLYLGHKNTVAAMPQAKAIDVKGTNFEPYFDPEGVSQGIIDFLTENQLA